MSLGGGGGGGGFLAIKTERKGWGEKLINNGIHDVKQLKMLIPFHKSRAHTKARLDRANQIGRRSGQ